MVSDREFFRGGVPLTELSVRVSWKAKLYAAWSVITGKILSVGDSPLVDLKEQTITANTNVGLISALLLNMVFPSVLDAAIQTNSYVVTQPEWVGKAYFALTTCSAWSLAMSTLFSILTIIVLNETSTAAESQYICTVAKSELTLPFKLTLFGWGNCCFALVLWLVIVCFNLSAIDECSTGKCGPFIYIFAIIFVLLNLISLYTFHNAVNLTAKLYKCRHKMTAHLRVTGSGENDVGASSKIVAIARPPIDPGSFHTDPEIDVIWRSLEAYCARDRKQANPIGFREFLIRSAGAGGLSYRAERLSEKLFETKLAQQLATEHSELLKRIDEAGPSPAAPELAGLDEFPRELGL